MFAESRRKKSNLKKNETCAPLAAVFGTLSHNFEKKKVPGNFSDYEER